MPRVRAASIPVDLSQLLYDSQLHVESRFVLKLFRNIRGSKTYKKLLLLTISIRLLTSLIRLVSYIDYYITTCIDFANSTDESRKHYNSNSRRRRSGPCHIEHSLMPLEWQEVQLSFLIKN